MKRRRTCLLETAVMMILFMAATAFGSFVAAADEVPWYELVDGRPVYLRQHSPSLPDSYGRVGEDGLVWYASFDGSLDANYIDDAGVLNTLEGRLQDDFTPVFRQGLRDRGLFLPGVAGGGLGGVRFDSETRGMPLVSAERGTLIFWMKFDDQMQPSRATAQFVNAGSFRFRIWTTHHVAIQRSVPPPHHHHALSIGDMRGWQMYAIRWDGDRIDLYKNGLPVTRVEWPIDGLNFLDFGSRSERAGDIIIDEVLVYNRTLTESEMRTLFLGTVKPLRQQSISVPRAVSPVDIDGRLDDSEWSGAARVEGFLKGMADISRAGTGNIADSNGVLLLQYDDQYLYVASKSYVPSEIQAGHLSTTALSGTVTIAAEEDRFIDPLREDIFDIMCRPAGADDILYRFMVNGRNRIREEKFHGGMLEHLDGEAVPWESGVRAHTGELEAEGAWLLEAAIPFSSLGIEPAAGVEMDFNLRRVWHLLQKGADSWAWGIRRGESIGSVLQGQLQPVNIFLEESESIPLGRLRLAPASRPYVRINRLGQLDSGMVDFQAALHNPGPVDIEVIALLITNAEEITVQEAIMVPAGGDAIFEHQQPITQYSNNELFFTAHAGGNILAQNSWNIVREQSLDIFLKQYPSAGRIVVAVDCGILSHFPPDRISVHLEILDGSGSSLLRKHTEPFTAYQKEVMLDVSEIPAGEHVITVDVMVDGEPEISDSMIYLKEPLPAWLGNDYGINYGDVPVPFTPVKRDGNIVDVWGRTYDLGGILPVHMKTQNMDLSAGPAELVIKTSGGAEVRTSSLMARLSWDEKQVTEAVDIDEKGLYRMVSKEVNPEKRQAGTAAAESQGIQIKNIFWIEYDGLLWSEITLDAKEDLTLSEAYLEIPLNPDFAGDRYGIWTGGGYGGLSAVIESPLWSDVRNARVIEEREGVKVLKLALLEREMKLSEIPMPLIINLQATPVRPPYPRYREHSWRIEGSRVHFDIAGWYPRDQVFVPAPENYYEHLITDHADENPEATRWGRRTGSAGVSRLYEGYAQWQPAPVIYAAPYFTDSINVRDSGSVLFRDEWSAGGAHVAPGTSRIRHTTAARSVVDFFLWRYGKLMDEIPYGAIYFDSVPHSVEGSDNIKGTSAYIHPTLGNRELMKRLYKLVTERYPDGILFDHSPGNAVMAYQSFVHFWVDGEQTWRRQLPGMENFSRVINVDEFRRKFMGHNYGPVGAWDVKLGNQAHTRKPALREAGTAGTISEHIQSILMLHDSSQHLWSFQQPGEYFNRLKDALVRHNWGSQYLMIPYWDQDIAEMPDGMYASFYLDPGNVEVDTMDISGRYIRGMETSPEKVICIFSNESGWEGEMRIRPDWKKLGFPSYEGLKAENAVHRLRVVYEDPADFSDNTPYSYVEDDSEYARIENGELVFPMTGWNYRMIVLEKK